MASLTRLQGIACIIIATGSFVANDTCMKLVMQDVPPLQVLFMRGVAASIFCLALVTVFGHGGLIRHAFNGWILVRGLCEAFAVVCFVIALARMPLADITAIYQISPLLVAGGVSLIWGERIGPLRTILITLGIAGALLVAQPGAIAASPYAILGFATAVGAAARDIISRQVRQEVPALVVTLSILLIVMAVAGIGTALAEGWVTPQPRHIALIAIAGALLVAAQFTIFMAYRFANARTLAPFYYCSTIWAVLSGLAVFGDIPNQLAIAGMALIVISGLAVIAIDSRRAPVAVG